MRQLPGQLDRSRQRQIAEQRDMGTAYFPATGFGRLQRNDQHGIHPIPMRNPGARSRARPVGICAMKMQCATPETTDMSACTYKPCTVITAPISIPAESALAPRREQFRPSHGPTGRFRRFRIREPRGLDRCVQPAIPGITLRTAQCVRPFIPGMHHLPGDASPLRLVSRGFDDLVAHLHRRLAQPFHHLRTRKLQVLSTSSRASCISWRTPTSLNSSSNARSGADTCGAPPRFSKGAT